MVSKGKEHHSLCANGEPLLTPTAHPLGALDQIRDLQSFIDNFQVHGADKPYRSVLIDSEKTEVSAAGEPFPSIMAAVGRTRPQALQPAGPNNPSMKQPYLAARHVLESRMTKALPKQKQLQKPNAKHDAEPHFSSNTMKVLANEPQIPNNRPRLSADLSSLLHTRDHAKADYLLAEPYYHERAFSNPVSAPQRPTYEKAPMLFNESYQTNTGRHQSSTDPVPPQRIPSPPPVRSRRASVSSRISATSVKSAKSTKSAKSPKSVKNAKRQLLQEKKMMLQQQQQQQGISVNQPISKQHKQKYVPRTYEEMMRIPDPQERMKFYEKTIDLCLSAESPISIWRKNLENKNGNGVSTTKAYKACSTPVTPRRSMHEPDFDNVANTIYEPVARPVLRRKATSEGEPQRNLHAMNMSGSALLKPNLKECKDNSLPDKDIDGSNKILVRAFSKFNLSTSKPSHGRATSWNYDNSFSYEEAVAAEIIPPVPSNKNGRKISQRNRVSAVSTSCSKEQLLTDQRYYDGDTIIDELTNMKRPVRRHSSSRDRTYSYRNTLTTTYATEESLEHLKKILPEVDMYTLKNALIETKGDPISAVSVALSLMKKKEEEAYSYAQRTNDSEATTTYYQPQLPKLQTKKSFMSNMKTSTAKLFKIKK